MARLGENDQLRMRGTTQSGVRLYNERLVLSLIRSYGSLPKAEIARLTGLSPQTVSVIVRQLESDMLVQKGVARKGKVGQPLQPFSLNPDGALAAGLKVGRRSAELVLVGLDGKIRHAVRYPYHFPMPADFRAIASRGFQEVTQGLPAALAKRICGLGVAAPFDLWNWEEEAGAPHEVMSAWRDFDLFAEVAAISPWPTLPCNDATAACAAELFFGKGRATRDFAYIYIGYFAGGGLVINGRLFQGATGNAGAIGSMLVPGRQGQPEQLIRSASLYLLDAGLKELGLDTSMLWQARGDWTAAEDVVRPWIATCARGLAVCSVNLASTLETSAIIIDGAMPADVRARLVSAVRDEVQQLRQDGLRPFGITEGSIGFDARALGAASLPLFANFMIDRDVLFKTAS